MARFTPDNELLARRIIARYPRPRSAMIPLCHLAQEQDGWLSNEPEDGDLGLIDVKDFEEHLAMDRMVALGVEQHKLALETLQLRLAELVDEDPLRIRLPVHVRHLCTAFQQALQSQGLPASTIPHIMDYFGKRFIGELDGVSDPEQKRKTIGRLFIASSLVVALGLAVVGVLLGLERVVGVSGADDIFAGDTYFTGVYAGLSSISRWRELSNDASFAAGITTSFHGSFPYRACAAARPRTVPGTPTAFCVRVESCFVNVVAVNALGAVSR